jgi:hopanoid biosynthesis associated radical SAM protein HpnH
MAVPLMQQIRVGAYVLKQRLMGRARYPLVLMLEPLFRCNLACPGCGKIDYPDDILNRRLSVSDCLAAARECGAPVVSIPGGEPLLHGEIDEVISGLVRLKKYVYLCTNGLLLEKKMHLFTPSPFLTFSVHLDGLEEEHDLAVDQEGVFRRAVAAIKKAKSAGFRVTVNATLFDNAVPERVAEFFDYVTDELVVEGITVSPGYAYERAPDQEHFLTRQGTKQLFRDTFRRGAGKKWRFNQSSLFLDFLAGNQTYRCSPWSTPTRNVFGWQRPCYLLNEGYTASFRELMNETEWARYGTGNYEKCADCMAHCGYEGTAVADSVAHPLKALRVALSGVATEGPMAPEIPLAGHRPAEFVYENLVEGAVAEISQKGSGGGRSVSTE